jgi:tetratricopeptide (TPR) repeat protein
MKGTMNDIFEIQEQVAAKVVEGLHVILTSEEKKKLAERGTDNAEAYELYLKGAEYYLRAAKETLQFSTQLFSEAIKLDEGYANAYEAKARALTALFRNYGRAPELLVEAESLCKEALRIDPNLFETHYPLSVLYIYQGKLDEAERTAKEFIDKAPDNPLSHFSLGFFYMETGQHAKAIPAFEKTVELNPESRSTLFNLAINCYAAKEMEKCKKYALIALPLDERYLKLHPDDEMSRMTYAILLFYCGRLDDARREATALKNAKDGQTIFNVACVFAMIRDYPDAIATFRKAIEVGYNNIPSLTNFMIDDSGIVQLRGTPEYEEVKQMVEKLSESSSSELPSSEP